MQLRNCATPIQNKTNTSMAAQQFICECCGCAGGGGAICSRCGFPCATAPALRRALGLSVQRRVAKPPRCDATPSPRSATLSSSASPTQEPPHIDFDGGGGAADDDDGIRRAEEQIGRLDTRWFKFHSAHLAALQALYASSSSGSAEPMVGYVRVPWVRSFLSTRASLIMQRQTLLAARCALGDVERLCRADAAGDGASDDASESSRRGSRRRSPSSSRGRSRGDDASRDARRDACPTPSPSPSLQPCEYWAEPLFAARGEEDRAAAARRDRACAMRRAVWGERASGELPSSASRKRGRTRARGERSSDEEERGGGAKRARDRLVLCAQLRCRRDAAQRQWRSSFALFRVKLLAQVSAELRAKIEAVAVFFGPACDPLATPALLLERRVIPAAMRCGAAGGGAPYSAPAAQNSAIDAAAPSSAAAAAAADACAALRRTPSAGGVAHQAALAQRLSDADALDSEVQIIRILQRLYVCIVACTSV